MPRISKLFAGLLVLAGCAGGDTNLLVDAGTPLPDAVEESRVGEEVVLPDAPGQDALPDLASELWDERAEAVFAPGCDPGEGCFEDKCAENSECRSGWCVDHMGEEVCTVACQDECPPGWSCQQVAGTDPDLVYVCVSDYANLCRPCSQASDCQGAAGTEDACISYGEGGSFCGGACGEDGECPWGFSCQEAETVDGVPLTQCVNDAGVCPCTDTSVALGLFTPCALGNDWGTCQGKRVCTDAGLSECDATEPTGETCNGFDDNCNGDIDEGTCEDGNQCTADFCAGEGGCEYEPLEGGECMDGNPCTVADHCSKGECAGTPVSCDDDNPCTDDGCDEAGGCLFADNDLDCDDGDPCTVADECADGQCAGFPINCQCVVDEDCAALEDGDLCNGILYCNQENPPYVCALAPGTVASCPLPEGPDAFCLQAVCAPDTGECSIETDQEGFACDDGNPCTAGDKCELGVCAGTVPVNCTDGTPCTDDSCSPESGCINTPNQAPCFDGNLCTVEDVCADGVCTGGPALPCDDGNDCTLDGCDPALGCAWEPLTGDDCDDGNACTTGDECVAGKCVAAVLECDDGNGCTDDACNLDSGGCVFSMNSAPCDDGDMCTAFDLCNLGQCVGGGQIACNDDNPCTDDSCLALVGCEFVPNEAACSDDNPCTGGDHCHQGKCSPTGMVDCDDGNPCTDDLCHLVEGCVNTPNAAPCNDGDPCTLTDACESGACAGADPDLCDDDNVCTLDTCVPLFGCTHSNADDTLCDDLNPCTTVDVCAGGQCAGDVEKTCDDLNVCTVDSCVPYEGCTYLADDGATCDDGNACTLVDTCASADCFGTGEPACSDGDACTVDACVPPGGCLYSPLVPCCGDGSVDPPEECDDGNVLDGDGCNGQCEEETSVTMVWTDGQTGVCSNTIYLTFKQIAEAMPDSPITVQITAKQVQPTPPYGNWTGTFENTTCVNQWLKAIGDRDTTSYNNWAPAVCQATEVDGTAYYFVCKSAGGNNPQIAIYPVGANAADYMKIYMLDRASPWCDLAGVDNKPGFDAEVTNSNSSGVAGDTVTFTWWW